MFFANIFHTLRFYDTIFSGFYYNETLLTYQSIPKVQLVTLFPCVLLFQNSNLEIKMAFFIPIGHSKESCLKQIVDKYSGIKNDSVYKNSTKEKSNSSLII